MYSIIHSSGDWKAKIKVAQCLMSVQCLFPIWSLLLCLSKEMNCNLTWHQEGMK